MTIGAWIAWIIGSLIIGGAIVGITAFASDYTSYKKRNTIIAIIVAVVLSILVLIGLHWYYGSTQSGSRALKSQESNFSDGIQREVKVYDATGNLIKEYKGKFDLEYDNDRILFDDENGNRHIIYYPTGTVLIDEVKE